MITPILFATVAALGVIGNRLAHSLDRPDRLLAGIALAGLGVVLGLAVTSCLSAPYSPWDMVRVAAPMAAVRGFPLYAGRDSGAILSTMYGPVGMLAFAPAALLDDPARAAILGRILALIFTSGPLVATCLMAGGKAPRSWRLGVLVLASFALIGLPSLRYSATSLHADAPALGLMGLACLGIGSNRPTTVFAAAMACILAVATKQTLVFLPEALVISVFVARGGRRAAVWAGFLVLAGVIVASAVGLTVDLGDLLLNAVSIPAGVPWKGHSPGNLMESLAELGWHALPLLIVGLCVGRVQRADSPTACQSFTLVALAMVPLAVLGRVKQAGDVNSFSPVLYPLLLAVVAKLAAIEPARCLRLGVASLLLVATILGALRLDFEANLLARLRPLDAESAFLRGHPGEVYLPWNPAAHLVAEGRPTHHLFSAWERGEAGFPVSKAHLLSAMPAGCRYVAFPLKRLGPVAGFGSSVQMLERHGLRVDRDHPVRLAGLPDYECFALTR